ncbi:MAG: RNA polymerase sigma factor [Coriobacteriia bacterium]|nr:RNA polymerase sigma factor [Coriobacteriia bacterium]
MNEKELTLVERTIAGDLQCYEELMRAYYPSFYAHANSFLKDSAEAQDMVQQALVRIWQNIGGLKEPVAFPAWSHQIVANLCKTELGRQNKPIPTDDTSTVFAELEDDDCETIPAVYTEREDLKARLGAVIDSLGTLQREALVLHYFQGMSIEEIAEATETTTNTVRQRLFQARKSIKDKIHEEEERTGERFYGVAGIALLALGDAVVPQLAFGSGGVAAANKAVGAASAAAASASSSASGSSAVASATAGKATAGGVVGAGGKTAAAGVGGAASKATVPAFAQVLIAAGAALAVIAGAVVTSDALSSPPAVIGQSITAGQNNGDAGLPGSEPAEQGEPEDAIEPLSQEDPAPDEEEAKPEPIVLSNTYRTQYDIVNSVTAPYYEFDYPDNWRITRSEVTHNWATSLNSASQTQMGEFITLTNARGVEIRYFSGPDIAGYGGNFYRADVKKVADSQFVPGWVQATDFSHLGSFMVARVSITGTMHRESHTEYQDTDGGVIYAVLPEDKVGLMENQATSVGLIEEGMLERILWGAGYGNAYFGASFICSVPEGGLIDREEEEIILILSSFR